MYLNPHDSPCNHRHPRASLSSKAPCVIFENLPCDSQELLKPNSSVQHQQLSLLPDTFYTLSSPHLGRHYARTNTFTSTPSLRYITASLVDENLEDLRLVRVGWGGPGRAHASGL